MWTFLYYFNLRLSDAPASCVFLTLNTRPGSLRVPHRLPASHKWQTSYFSPSIPMVIPPYTLNLLLQGLSWLLVGCYTVHQGRVLRRRV
jgi:hypothetical protein